MQHRIVCKHLDEYVASRAVQKTPSCSTITFSFHLRRLGAEQRVQTGKWDLDEAYDFHNFRTHLCCRLDTIGQVFVGHDPDTYFQCWTLGSAPGHHLPFQSTLMSVALIQQRNCVFLCELTVDA